MIEFLVKEIMYWLGQIWTQVWECLFFLERKLSPPVQYMNKTGLIAMCPWYEWREGKSRSSSTWCVSNLEAKCCSGAFLDTPTFCQLPTTFWTFVSALTSILGHVMCWCWHLLDQLPFYFTLKPACLNKRTDYSRIMCDHLLIPQFKSVRTDSLSNLCVSIRKSSRNNTFNSHYMCNIIFYEKITDSCTIGGYRSAMFDAIFILDFCHAAFLKLT